MKRIIVASRNAAKLTVARKAFVLVFPKETFQIVAVKTETGDPAQPFDEEILRAAKNRLVAIRTSHPDADYWISQEGGLIRDVDGGLYNRATIIVADRAGHIAKSDTASYALPKGIATLVDTGLEYGAASDIYWNTVGLKEGAGGISHITDSLIDRTHFYLQAAIIAFASVKNHHLYI